jgi:hypothetical protein
MDENIMTVIHDDSEVTRLEDFHARKRELEARAITRAAVLHAAWRPMLAGAVGAALVIGAVYVTLPKFSTREVVVDHVVSEDVTVDHIVPHDVQVDHVITKEVTIEIPRLVATSPAPRSPEEKAFVGTEGWRDAVVRGRILRQDGNGFVLMTDAGEQSFYPARIGADGKPELNLSIEDIVAPYISDLGYCRRLPVGTFECVALHEGQEVFIRQNADRRQAGEAGMSETDNRADEQSMGAAYGTLPRRTKACRDTCAAVPGRSVVPHMAKLMDERRGDLRRRSRR